MLTCREQSLDPVLDKKLMNTMKKQPQSFHFVWCFVLKREESLSSSSLMATNKSPKCMWNPFKLCYTHEWENKNTSHFDLEIKSRLYLHQIIYCWTHLAESFARVCPAKSDFPPHENHPFWFQDIISARCFPPLANFSILFLSLFWGSMYCIRNLTCCSTHSSHYALHD